MRTPSFFFLCACLQFVACGDDASQPGSGSPSSATGGPSSTATGGNGGTSGTGTSAGGGVSSTSAGGAATTGATDGVGGTGPGAGGSSGGASGNGGSSAGNGGAAGAAGGSSGAGGASGASGASGNGGGTPDAGDRSDAGADATPDASHDAGSGAFALNGVGFLTRAGVNGPVFPDPSCNPNNHSPAFTWSGVPQGTKSLAMSLYDTGAYPEGTDKKAHWVLWDIAPSVTSLPYDVPHVSPLTMPASLAGAGQKNLQANPSYFGPGANQRVYVFTIWALNVDKLTPTNGDAQTIFNSLAGKSLGSATFKATGKQGGFGDAGP